MIAGVDVGHWSDPVGLTGCTVVLPPAGTVASCEVRGGSPGTRETDLLRPGMRVNEAHAIVLTGGSAYGLAAADGVMRWLEERGRGFDAEVALVPIVPAAVLFDLGVGDAAARPGPEHGYAACEAATASPSSGRVGAGTGATVAKLHGRHRAVPGGMGIAVVEGGGARMAAIAAVNALGEVVDDDGSVLAGALPGPEEPPTPEMNTTIAVVATDARLSRERAHRLAVAAHEGLARAVRPAHTMLDGDAVFTLATGMAEASQAALEGMAEEALARAIRLAVTDEGDG